MQVYIATHTHIHMKHFVHLFGAGRLTHKLVVGFRLHGRIAISACVLHENHACTLRVRIILIFKIKMKNKK